MAELSNILGPIVIIALIGYALERAAVGLDLESLGRLILLVATPSLIFHTLISLDVDPGTLIQMALAAVIAMTAAGILGMIVLRLTGASFRMFLPSLIFPNSGNMGLALVLLTFGDEGMKLGISYFFMVSTVQHTVGLSISAGVLDLRYLMRQPVLLATTMALLVIGFDFAVPEVVMTTTKMLGGVMIPASLILLGASLATLKIANLAPALGMAVTRLTIGLATATFVIWLLDFSGVAAGTVFLLATMPIAIINHIYAHRYSENSTAVSGAIAVSTLMTFLCLPALIWAALWIANNG